MVSLPRLLLLLAGLSKVSSFASRRRCVSKIGVLKNCAFPFLATTMALTASTKDTEISKEESSGAKALTLAKSTKNTTTSVLAMQQQAATLRAEIATIERELQASKEAKRQKELADIDRWIEECLYVRVKTSNKDDDTTTTTTAARIELLNSVETAAQVLRDNRFSHEQVSKMFERICDTSPAQSRSNCSPLLALLVDAAGKLDCVDREKNPNKRWDGRVERDLRKRLFAMDWNIHLEPFRDDNDRFI